MFKLEIEIKPDWTAEVARILREVASEIERFNFGERAEGSVRDITGNRWKMDWTMRKE